MYIADLHIHSKYSRATSAKCEPEYLDLWARKKGISLLGTGDFTHPVWRQELRDKLEPAEEGFYTLRQENRLDAEAPADSVPARFVVSGEISSIYKKNGKVRKVHNVILLPSLDAAETLAKKLEAIGNIHSDGRPILGLDSHDLLEITLESCAEAIFIPAHIWTPHFSLFGAFSGFDTIEECFEDLTPHISALETGLSSDPPMNWMISALDGYTLVSNSDAHSPNKLGREANLLDTGLSYPELKHAIETGEGFAGTIEFFPEEGKYHLDGHRKCGLCLQPSETVQYGGRCPVCGRKITIGVQHRVEQLADRALGYRPEHAKPFESLAPLPEVISASLFCSASKAERVFETMLQTIGPEFTILRESPLEQIRETAGPCVAEGIRRLRQGEVERIAGYDGEYGTIKLLDKAEMDFLNGQVCLFGQEDFAVKPKEKKIVLQRNQKKEPEPEKQQSFGGLNAEQETAVTAQDRAVAVIAGPGTGKTKTLISKIEYLVKECGVKPSEVTAVTFTNKAAGEMRERLEKQLKSKGFQIGTFHSICMRQLTGGEGVLADEYTCRETAEQVIAELSLRLKPRRFLQEVSRRKCGQAGAGISDEAFQRYCDLLRENKTLDYDDLLIEGLKMAEQTDNEAFSYLLVDEFQDINDLQYQMVKAWNKSGKQLFVIGDPDQSIYGFRGSSENCFEQLLEDFDGLKLIRLKNNYRSTPEILQCALPVISQNGGQARILDAQRENGAKVRMITAESELSEGIFVAKEINRLTGGIDMLDAQRYAGSSETTLGFSDIAVLYRTHRQAKLLESCLKKEGIPYTVAGRDDWLSEDKVRGTIGFFRFLLDSSDTNSIRLCMKHIWDCPEDLIDNYTGLWKKSGVNNPSADDVDRISSPYADSGYLQRGIGMMKTFLAAIKEPPDRLVKQWAEENYLGEELKPLENTAVFYPSMETFLQDYLLGQESDLVRSGGKAYDAGTVKLMTLHGSKGLEFPAVFLCGAVQGCIPLESAGRETDIGEERRLFYVGMTRARDELYLLTSREPSSFLKDIPKRCLERENAGGTGGKQLSLFDL